MLTQPARLKLVKADMLLTAVMPLSCRCPQPEHNQHFFCGVELVFAGMLVVGTSASLGNADARCKAQAGQSRHVAHLL